MAKGRDRPRHQEKRKPKAKAPKVPPVSAYEQQPMSVEVIKPKRKPRSEPGDRTEPGEDE
jgi:hypothetical protein